MSNKVSRPPTIWLTQAILILFSLLLLGVTALNLMTLSGRAGGGASVPAVVLGSLIPVSLSLLLLTSFWGLAKRKLYGKWLALLSLALLWALVLLGQALRPAGRLKYYEYYSTAEVAGAVIATVFIHGFFLVLIARLAFSKRVNGFFQISNTAS